MAGHYLQSLLGERENIILSTRHHWFILVSSIILEIVLILIIFSATLIGIIQLNQNQLVRFRRRRRRTEIKPQSSYQSGFRPEWDSMKKV